MKTSTNGIELIKMFESLRLKAYKCPAGVWTIGYGHTAGVTEGMIITKQQAEQFLKDDLAGFEQSLTRYKLQINQNMFDACVSFMYNMGTGSFARSTLLKKIKANPTDVTIRSEFAKWNKGGGKVLQGLIRRRAAEADLYFLNV